MRTMRAFSIKILMIFAIFFAASTQAFAIESPDALIKRLSDEVFAVVSQDKEIQAGNPVRIRALVEDKLFPHIDFERMTALAAGRHWRTMDDSQKSALTKEFRDLLVHTYSGAIAQIKDQKIQFDPLRADPNDTDVVVRSKVIQTGGRAPIQLDYRLYKKDGGDWKVYDLNVLGAWLLQSYRGTFDAEIKKSGVDGLIKTLSEKNKTISSKKK